MRNIIQCLDESVERIKTPRPTKLFRKGGRGLCFFNVTAIIFIRSYESAIQFLLSTTHSYQYFDFLKTFLKRHLFSYSARRTVLVESRRF